MVYDYFCYVSRVVVIFFCWAGRLFLVCYFGEEWHWTDYRFVLYFDAIAVFVLNENKVYLICFQG